MKKAHVKPVMVKSFTPCQYAWIKTECTRTGENMTGVLRRLVQEKIDRKITKKNEVKN